MVEPGFWKTWKNADGSVCLDPKGDVAVWAKLEQQLFVDLAEASKVNWKDVDAVSAADWLKLTELPEAMPTLRRLLTELGVEPVENYKGASEREPPPAPSRAEEEEQVRLRLQQEEEEEVKLLAADPLAKYRRSYTEDQITANRAKVALRSTAIAMYAAAEEGDAAVLLNLSEPWFAHPVLNDYSGNGGNWTPLMAASRYGHIECVRALVAQPGIEPNKGSRNTRGTALLWASWNGHVDIVELLCSLPGIDCNKADKDGDTPHSFACSSYAGSDSEERTRTIRAILEAKEAKTAPSLSFPSNPNSNLVVPDGVGNRLYNAACDGKVDEVSEQSMYCVYI